MKPEEIEKMKDGPKKVKAIEDFVEEIKKIKAYGRGSGYSGGFKLSE